LTDVEKLIYYAMNSL